MMREVTEEEVAEALAANTWTERTDKGILWYFKSESIPYSLIPGHTEENARRIARFCLMLEQPVSDIMWASVFGALVDEVADLKRRIHRLGGYAPLL